MDLIHIFINIVYLDVILLDFSIRLQIIYMFNFIHKLCFPVAFIYVYINCLLWCLSVRLYPINVKTDWVKILCGTSHDPGEG